MVLGFFSLVALPAFAFLATLSIFFGFIIFIFNAIIILGLLDLGFIFGFFYFRMLGIEMLLQFKVLLLGIEYMFNSITLANYTIYVGITCHLNPYPRGRSHGPTILNHDKLG